MKDLKDYIAEKLRDVILNEGPGSGVSMDFYANLRFNIEIKDGKAILDEWFLNDCEAKVKSYDYNFTINNAWNILDFKVAGVTPRMGRGGRNSLAVVDKDVTAKLRPVLDTPLYDFLYDKDDFNELKERLGDALNDYTTIREASKLFTINIVYDKEFEITNISLNSAGYIHNHLDVKTNLENKYVGKSLYDTERCEADGKDLSFIKDPKKIREAIDSVIMPEFLRPTKRLVDIYETIYFFDPMPEDDPDDIQYIVQEWEHEFDIEFN